MLHVRNDQNTSYLSVIIIFEIFQPGKCVELVGEDERIPQLGKYMTTIKEWGPEYEIRLQIRFINKALNDLWGGSVFRFTTTANDSSEFTNSLEPGGQVPSMMIFGRRTPFNLYIVAPTNDRLHDYFKELGDFSVLRYYFVKIKQYRKRQVYVL